jgi:hypothetical protein
VSPGKWRTLQGPHPRPVRRPPDTVATGRIVGKREVGPDLKLRILGNWDPRRWDERLDTLTFRSGNGDPRGAPWKHFGWMRPGTECVANPVLTPRPADCREMASADIHPDRPSDDSASRLGPSQPDRVRAYDLWIGSR